MRRSTTLILGALLVLAGCNQAGPEGAAPAEKQPATPEPAASSEVEEAAAERDPCTLITQEEAEAAAGGELLPCELPGYGTGTWQGPGDSARSVGLALWSLVSGGTPPEGWCEEAHEAWGDPEVEEEIPGLGTGAWWNSGGAQGVIGVGLTGLVVCTEGEAFVIYLLGEGSEPELREKATGLAELVIDRV